MPPIPVSFLLFEFGIYALALVCLRHAWRQGPYLALAIVTATIFAFAGESLVIRLTGEYYYNHFLVMLCLGGAPGGFGVTVSCGDHSTCVPLAVPIMESLIVYAAMQTTDRLRLPWAARSLLDGLLALSIDFGLDPIVSRSTFCAVSPEMAPIIPPVGVGLWVWKLDSAVEAVAWIDLNNYAGWFLGVAVFSFTQRLLRQRVAPGSRGLSGDIWMAIISLPLAMLFFAPLVLAYRFIVQRHILPEWILFSALIGASLAVSIYYGRRAERDNPIDPVTLAVPTFLYLYALAVLVVGGYYVERPVLFLYWALTLAIGALGFTWPSWDRLLGRRVARAA